MKKYILIIIGTRPEAIKMAPVIIKLKDYPESFKVKVCITGQHKEMLNQVLNLFEIQPDFNLLTMQNDQSLTDITTTILKKTESLLTANKPDLILVHGDTATTMAASLAAFYCKVPVGHVEAGLRTYNLDSPFPEELNRSITTKIAKYHFPPTTQNRLNLLRESIDENSIVVTGNTVIDSLLMIKKKISGSSVLRKTLTASLEKSGYKIGTRKLFIVTAHRRENFGKRLDNICHAILDLSRLYPDTDIVYPVHSNPNVAKSVNKILKGEPNIYLLPPLDYLTFVFLMLKSQLILTDSGGIQEEAPYLGKPVVVLREHTERNESLESGLVMVAGSNRKKIVSCVVKLAESDNIPVKNYSIYGEGNSSQRIVDFLLKSYEK